VVSFIVIFLLCTLFLNGFFFPGPAWITAQQTVWSSAIHGMMFGVSMIFSYRDTVSSGDSNLSNLCISSFADSFAVFDTILFVTHYILQSLI
jgi:hypothetical protein